MNPRLPSVTPCTAAVVLELIGYARSVAPSAPLEWLQGFAAARVVEPRAEGPRDTLRSTSGRAKSVLAGCALSVGILLGIVGCGGVVEEQASMDPSGSECADQRAFAAAVKSQCDVTPDLLQRLDAPCAELKACAADTKCSEQLDADLTLACRPKEAP